MNRKPKSFSLEPLIEFMTDRIKVPTKKEIDKLIKKTEQSLLALKVPTRADFDRLTKRVEALENALKAQKKETKVTARPKARKRTAPKKKPVSRAKPKMTSSGKVLEVMKKSRGGVNVAKLKASTGFEDKKIRNVLSRLSKQGKVKRAGRGIYKAVA